MDDLSVDLETKMRIISERTKIPIEAIKTPHLLRKELIKLGVPECNVDSLSLAIWIEARASPFQTKLSNVFVALPEALVLLKNRIKSGGIGKHVENQVEYNVPVSCQLHLAQITYYLLTDPMKGTAEYRKGVSDRWEDLAILEQTPKPSKSIIGTIHGSSWDKWDSDDWDALNDEGIAMIKEVDKCLELIKKELYGYPHFGCNAFGHSFRILRNNVKGAKEKLMCDSVLVKKEGLKHLYQIQIDLYRLDHSFTATKLGLWFQSVLEKFPNPVEDTI